MDLQTARNYSPQEVREQDMAAGPSAMVRSTKTTPGRTTSNVHNKAADAIKFLCSYGGKILPRYPDGMLRYLGGQTRVLIAPPPFQVYSYDLAELMAKLRELCGEPVFLRCQLPKEHLDSLVSITSDEDLANLIEEYDCTGSDLPKIRAFLSLPKPNKQDVFPSKASASSNFGSSYLIAPRFPTHMVGPAGCLHQQLLKMGNFTTQKSCEWKVPFPLPTYHNSGVAATML